MQFVLYLSLRFITWFMFFSVDKAGCFGCRENIVGSNNTSCNTRQPLRTGLVIDGQTLEFALDDDLKDDFLELAKACHSVVCCRSTPIQKV